MATITPAAPGDERVVFQNVAWRTYLDLSDARGEGHIRLTYHRGVLEIMTLSKLHERLSEILGGFVKVLAKEYGLEVGSAGSMTMRTEERQIGAEADKSYYLRHEEIVRERDEYDPRIDPPPDLVIEVDLSSTSSRRMLVYAELGIPELWRYDGERLTFKSLGSDGKYQTIDRSITFPGLPSAGVESFLHRRGAVGELALDEELRQWIRASLKSDQP